MIGTIHIVGDVHGQYPDVVAIFSTCGNPSANNPYLVNGDFVDRGSMGVEVLIALIAWKLVDARSIHLNRGNQSSSASR
jgi:serine/threonine-protein phosphatase 5